MKTRATSKLIKFLKHYSVLIFLLVFIQISSNSKVSSQCNIAVVGDYHTGSITDGEAIWYCVKLYFYIVRMSDGSGGVPDTRIDTLLDYLEEAYDPHYIQFYWDENITYIDNDLVYQNPVDVALTNVIEVYDNEDGVDIYLTKDSETYAGAVAQVDSEINLGFTIGGTLRDFGWLVHDSHIISHELGHILRLDHTFCESTPYELVDGSNCETKGDELCDTPASPPFGGLNFEVSVGCEWEGYEEDANNDPYDPLINNYMEYTRLTCMDSFTDGQVDRMRASMEQSSHLDEVVSSEIFGEIVYTGDEQDLHTVNFVPDQNSTTTIQALGTDDFDWTKTSGSADYWGTNNDGTELTLELAESGSISFSVSYESFCYGDHSFTFIHSGGYFSSYPNPVDNCFIIEASESKQYIYKDAMNVEQKVKINPLINNVRVNDKNGNLVKVTDLTTGVKDVELCLSGNEPGLYFVEINRGEKLYNTLKVILN